MDRRSSVLIIMACLTAFLTSASAATSDICSSGSKDTTCTVAQTYDVTDQMISGSGDLLIKQSGALQTSSGSGTSASLRFDNITVRGEVIGNFNVTASEMRLTESSTLSADAKGFRSQSGPGAGDEGEDYNDYEDTGAGYGGRGGDTRENSDEGDVYGSVRNPRQLGSGGGTYNSKGGGKILLNISGKFISETPISADAEEDGNGAGGTVNLNASALEGNISVSASGGEGGYEEGGGAGGRIAVRYDDNQTDSLTFDISPGTAGSEAQPGDQGTVFIRESTGEKVAVKGTPDLASTEIQSQELVLISGSEDIRIPASNISSNYLSVEDQVIAELQNSDTNLTDVSVGNSSDLSLRGVSSDISNITVGNLSVARMTAAESDLDTVEAGIDSSITYSGEPVEPDKMVLGNRSLVSIQNSILNETEIDLSYRSVLGVQNSTVIKQSLSVNSSQTLQAGVSRPTRSTLNVSSLDINGTVDGTLEASGSEFLAGISSDIKASSGPGKEISLSYGNIEIRGDVRTNLDISATDILVTRNASISADGKGFRSESGPGAGDEGEDYNDYEDTGAGYGGRGGDTRENSDEGDVYGSVRNPRQLGSGGGRYNSKGGGKILIDATGTADIRSNISADAEEDGNGAGGTVNLNASVLEGNVSLSATGGEGGYEEGGGAGGRIAVRYDDNQTDYLRTDVLPGTAGSEAQPGDQGTVFIRETTGEKVAVKGTPNLESVAVNSDRLVLLPDSDDIRLSGSNISSTDILVGARVVAELDNARTNLTQAIIRNSSDISLRGSSSNLSTVKIEDSSVFRMTNAVSDLETVKVGNQSSLSYSGKPTNPDIVTSGTASTVAIQDSTFNGTEISLSDGSTLDITNSSVIKDSLSLNSTQTVVGGFSRPTETVLNITSFRINGTVDGVVDASGDSLNLTRTGRIQSDSGTETAFIVDYDDTDLSGTLRANVDVSAQDLDISAQATVSADGKGFRSESGPGAGDEGEDYNDYEDTGAGYGGRGGDTRENSDEGDSYGSFEDPVQLGSGGGRYNSKGGGKILIDAQNANIETTLSADAEEAGNGAGGTVNLNTSTLEGNISISASGGEGDYDTGGGAGGRIAVRYDDNQTDSLTFDISPGEAGSDAQPGEQGTVFIREQTGDILSLAGTPDIQNRNLDSQVLKIQNGSDDVRLENTRITAVSLKVGESARADLDNSDTDLSSISVRDSASLDFRNSNSSVQDIELGYQASVSMSRTSSNLSSISAGKGSSLSYGSVGESVESLEMNNGSTVSLSNIRMIDASTRIGPDTSLRLTNSTVESDSLILNSSQRLSTSSTPDSRTELDIDRLEINGTLEGVFDARGTAIELSSGGKIEGPTGKNTDFNAYYDKVNISGVLRANTRILSTDFKARPGSVISADGKGFRSESGPGAGDEGEDYNDYEDTGAGHGGRGGDTRENSDEGDVYGSVRNPRQLGSGGGRYNSKGGGKIIIDTETARISTEISADAEEDGNGAGGTVNLNTSILEGNISISASGGEGDYDTGGGAGGRIAVRYDNNQTDYLRTDVLPGTAGSDAQPGDQGTVFLKNREGKKLLVGGTPQLESSEIDVKTLVLGNGSEDIRLDESEIQSTELTAETGTTASLYRSDTNLTALEAGSQVQLSAQQIDSDIVNITAGSGSSIDLDLSNSSLRRIEIGNNSVLSHRDLGSDVSRLRAGKGSSVSLSGASLQRPDLDIGGSVSLTLSNSSLRFEDLDLNATQSIRTGSRSQDRATLEFDSLELNGTLDGIFNLEGDRAVIESSGSFVTPSGPGSTSKVDAFKLTVVGEMDGNFRMNSDEITALPGSVISADGKGFGRESGPGAGEDGGEFDNYEHGGGGHGGEGGRSEDGAFGGDEYGNRTDPKTLGSGGGGGTGGGRILMEATKRINLSTEVTANAEEFGNGAGGSISISAKRIAGNFSLKAEGGEDNYDDGAGAGGRIAVKYSFNETESTSFSVEPGKADGGGDDGEPGTVFTDILRIDFCDDRGLQDQCIVNTTKRVFRGLVEINSPLFTQESTRVFPQNQSTTFRFKNETTLSGSWRGNMTIEGDDIEIGAGAEFRPESGTITVR